MILNPFQKLILMLLIAILQNLLKLYLKASSTDLSFEAPSGSEVLTLANAILQEGAIR